MLQSTDGKGFCLAFANGVTISVQFGKMNYCQQNGKEVVPVDGVWQSDDAEVLISYQNRLVGPLGHLGADQVAMLIMICKAAGWAGKDVIDEIKSEIIAEEVC